ncbi:LytTR family DNA-binding domain-containing protein [uncultured Roseobacter sp.]|uniref:LytTR family DNA-binding domain-containing protein n=1 Tax=uncultured Roseobacter sp. TaxID=114847 RepID=UPI00262A9EE0|nr:LytTR family DNA-binding domain-containing protein [uncultured Roseobacter sp.]
MPNVVNDSAVTYALFEARDLGSRPRFWLGMTGVSLVLGLVGPFGTFETLPIAGRISYWSVVCLVSFWVGFLTSTVLAGLAEDRGLPDPVAVMLGGLGASLPIAGIISAMDAAVFGASFWSEVVRLLPYVAVISIVVAALFEVMSGPDTIPVTAAETPDLPEWTRRLPAEIGRDLIALQAQDHYVTARTPKGETLLRTSMTEAEEALGAYGLRVHRSWWVARQWIDRVETRKGRLMIVLRDGALVPVGRVYRSAVRKALQRP